MEKAVDNIKKLIGGLIAITLICVIGALIAFNPIVSSVVGGMVATSDLQNRVVLEVHDRNFRTSCALYKDASTWERWTTPMHWSDSWCEEYLDRM